MWGKLQLTRTEQHAVEVHAGGLSTRAQQMTGSLCRAKDGCGVLGQSRWQGDEVKG